MNNFYKQLIILLWLEAIILMGTGFYPAILIIEAGYSQPLLYLSFFVYIAFLQLTTSPFNN